MNVVVIGGGVIGATSAYALMQAGCHVTLVDRAHPDDGIATHVNAWLVAPGHTLAWATPQMLLKLPSVIANRTPQLRVRARGDLDLIRWGLAFMRNCTNARAAHTTRIRGQLGRVSRHLLDRLIGELQLESITQEGMLFVHANQANLQRQWAAMSILRTEGHDLRLIDRAGCLTIEPVLAESRVEFVGGVYHRGGMTADCGAFTTALRERGRQQGMHHLEADVTGLRFEGDRVAAATTANGDEIRADAFVVAAGAHTPRVLGRSGTRLKMYPVRGYGLTWNKIPDEVGPRLGGIDETNLIAWSRSGPNLRMTGIAEFNGFTTTPHRGDLDGVRSSALRLFPWLSDLPEPHVSSGFRPMTADGLPRIGRWSATNLFVNTGHGNLGWTLACGSAQILAGAVTGSGDPQFAEISEAVKP